MQYIKVYVDRDSHIGSYFHGRYSVKYRHKQLRISIFSDRVIVISLTFDASYNPIFS